jgi:hypothetical protein
MEFRNLTVILVSMLLVAPFLVAQNMLPDADAQTTPDIYVGVDMGYGNYFTGASQAKTLIDQVRPYTNLFIVGSSGITTNAGALGDVLQYAYDKGMYFISFVPQFFNLFYLNSSLGSSQFYGYNSTQWFDYAEANWTDHLLGFMYPVEDEPGGKMLDRASDRPVRITNNTSELRYGTVYTSNISEAALAFEDGYGTTLGDERTNPDLNGTNYPLFTSDYALYWFDYKAGQDGVFAEFAGNYSRQLNMALCRGAAQVQGKEWGVTIAYKTSNYPYLESGDDLYKDMVTAYDGGAKYIVIFDTNPTYTGDILQSEHYTALKNFWTYVQNNPRKSTPVNGRTALVLPANYGFGFRGPNDSVWGVWNALDFSYGLTINSAIGNLLRQYGNKLDIIYDDGTHYSARYYGYQNVIYWDDPSLQPTPTPSSTHSPTPTPLQTTSSEPKQTPTNPPATTSTPTSTLQPTATPNQKDPTATYIIAVIAVGVLAGFLCVAIVLRRIVAQS